MNQDLYNNLGAVVSIEPQTVAGDVTGVGVDVLEYGNALFVASADASTVSTFKLQEGDTLGGSYADVAAAGVIGTQGTSLVQSGTAKIGYIGDKRFVRAFITHGTGGEQSVTALLGLPRVAPVA